MISSRFESGSVPERVLRPDAPVAQLDRAPGFEPVGRGFNSLRARHSRESTSLACARSSAG